MAKKKLTRKELLKGADEFMTLSGKVALYSSQHLRELKLAGIGLAVVVVAYISIWAYMGHTNKMGQEAYNVAYDALIQSLKPEEADEESMKKPEALFEAVISDYGMSKAPSETQKEAIKEGIEKLGPAGTRYDRDFRKQSIMTLRTLLLENKLIEFFSLILVLMSGEVNMNLDGSGPGPGRACKVHRHKQYDDAIGYYQEFSSKVSGNEAYETLTLLALAACHEAKGDMEKAVSILAGIVKTSDNPFRENAMLNLERVYRLDKQPEKADEILKNFAKEYANSPFYPMVKARI